MRVLPMRTRTLPLLIIAALTSPVFAASFNLSSNSTTAQTLSAGGDTGTIQTGVSLTISGSTTAVTLSNTSGTVTLNNSGTISQTGSGRGIRGASSGTATTIINNNAGASITSVGDDVIQARSADSNWTITNNGTISQTGGSGQAIDFNDITSGTVSITNNATGIISALYADAIRTGANATIVNHGTITATPDSTGSSSDGIDTQANSGVTITNDGTISGRTGITGGEDESTYTLTVNNNAGGLILGVNGSGINTDGALNTNNIVTVNNASGATIQGTVMASTANGDGDGVDVDGIAYITNSGDILGYGAKGAGSDTFSNNSEGISIGGGTIINTATGRIIGSTLLADAPNGDATREGHGILVDNSSGGSALAATTITNSGLIEGRSGYAIKMIGDFADTITNNEGGIIRGTNLSTAAAAVQMGGGNDVFSNSGSVIHALGDAETAISMEGGDDTVNILGGTAVVTGGIDGGTGTNTLNFDLGSATNTFSHSASISNFSAVNVISGKTSLSGTSTYTGTTTIGGGSAAARLEQNGVHTGGEGYEVRTNGTLAGTGQLTLSTTNASITVNQGGWLDPGTETSTGRFTLEQGNIVLDGGADFTIDGTDAGVAGGYDQLQIVTGNLTLGNASTLALTANYEAAVGTLFTLFDLVDDNATITGTFAGLEEGAVLTDTNGRQFTISYIGGTGNDIVITAIPEVSSISLLGSLATLSFWIRRRKDR
ncbi:MAG: hypothetical protein QM680_04120 [Luteolibacter sp.]